MSIKYKSIIFLHAELVYSITTLICLDNVPNSEGIFYASIVLLQEREARREEKIRYTCKCSFLEIYNEQILDLLDPSSLNLQVNNMSLIIIDISPHSQKLIRLHICHIIRNQEDFYVVSSVKVTTQSLDLYVQIREDTKKGVYVDNLTEVEVTSARDVIQQLVQVCSVLHQMQSY